MASLAKVILEDPRFVQVPSESGSGRPIVRGLRVENFRAISQVGLTLRLSRLTTLIGPNNCGKTSLLRALELFVTDRVEGKSLTEEDYYLGDTSQPVVVEVILGNLPQDINEAFERHLQPDGRLLLRKEFRLIDGRIQIDTLALDEEFKDPQLQGLNAKNRDQLIEIADRIGAERAKSNAERVQKIKERAHALGKKLTRTWSPLAKERIVAIQEVLPVPATVSAFSTPEETERFVQSLLQRPVESALSELAEARDQVRNAVMTTANEFFSNVELALKDQDPTIVELKPQVAVNLARSVATQFEITDRGGHSSDLYYKGAGTQRNLVIAATRIASDWEARRVEDAKENRGLFILIDEPEVFLHPGAQRNLFEVLEELASNDNQVVMSTHSTVFIDTTHLHNVVLLTILEGRVAVVQVPSKPDDPITEAKTHRMIREDLGIRNSDIFFSDVVLLCEGKSDELYLKAVYAELFNRQPESEAVQIKHIGGKGKLAPLREMLPLLRQLHIPYVVVLDRDAVEERWSLRVLRRLVARGLLLPNNCKVWSQGEIEEYYGPATLGEAVSSWASERDIDYELPLERIASVLAAEQEDGVFDSIHRICFEETGEKLSKDDLSRHVAGCLHGEEIPSEVAALLVWTLRIPDILSSTEATAILSRWGVTLEEAVPSGIDEILESNI